MCPLVCFFVDLRVPNLRRETMSGGMIGVFVAILMAVVVFVWLQKRKPM